MSSHQATLALGPYFSWRMKHSHSNGMAALWVSLHGTREQCVSPDGTAVAWGYNVEDEANVPVGLSAVKAIAAGLSWWQSRSRFLF